MQSSYHPRVAMLLLVENRSLLFKFKLVADDPKPYLLIKLWSYHGFLCLECVSVPLNTYNCTFINVKLPILDNNESRIPHSSIR